MASLDIFLPFFTVYFRFTWKICEKPSPKDYYSEGADVLSRWRTVKKAFVLSRLHVILNTALFHICLVSNIVHKHIKHWKLFYKKGLNYICDIFWSWDFLLTFTAALNIFLIQWSPEIFKHNCLEGWEVLKKRNWNIRLFKFPPQI